MLHLFDAYCNMCTKRCDEKMVALSGSLCPSWSCAAKLCRTFGRYRWISVALKCSRSDALSILFVLRHKVVLSPPLFMFLGHFKVLWWWQQASCWKHTWKACRRFHADRTVNGFNVAFADSESVGFSNWKPVHGWQMPADSHFKPHSTIFHYFCCDQSLCKSEVESRLGPRNPEVGLCGTKKPERYKVVWTCTKHDVFEIVGILRSLYLIVNYHELPMNLHIIELRRGAFANIWSVEIGWNQLKSTAPCVACRDWGRGSSWGSRRPLSIVDRWEREVATNYTK